MHPYVVSRPHAAALLVGVLLACLLLGTGLVVVAGWPGSEPTRPRAVADRSLVAPRAEVRAAALLADWDRRRARVWASGRPIDLDALYVPGSAAGRRDAAMLAAWRARGLRVEDLRIQVLGLRVLAHRAGRFELEVVDRVVAGTAVGAGLRRALPRDAPTTRRVVLVDDPAGWRVESVSVGPAGAGPAGDGSVSAGQRPARP